MSGPQANEVHAKYIKGELLILADSFEASAPDLSAKVKEMASALSCLKP